MHKQNRYSPKKEIHHSQNHTFKFSSSISLFDFVTIGSSVILSHLNTKCVIHNISVRNAALRESLAGSLIHFQERISPELQVSDDSVDDQSFISLLRQNPLANGNGGDQHFHLISGSLYNESLPLRPAASAIH